MNTKNKRYKNPYILISFLILLIFSVIYFQKQSESSVQSEINQSEKASIDLRTIKYVEIRNHSNQPDSIKTIRKRLNIEQTKIFVAKWNESKSIGFCKYFPNYWIDLYFIDGSKRTFRINGKNVKEKNDWCFDFMDKNYIIELWKSAR